MEDYDDLRKTGQVVCSTNKEEKRDQVVIMIGNSSGGDDQDCKEGIHLLKDGRKLEMARAQMGEVREENQRLRLYLDQIMKDYQILQKKFQEIMKMRSAAAATMKQQCSDMEDSDQLVSLSLGRTFSGEFKKDTSDTERSKTTPAESHDERECMINRKEGLALGLEYTKFEVSSTTQAESSVHLSPKNSKEEAKTWPAQKNLKMKRSVEDDHSNEATPQNPPKKTRVSVRVRCDTPTMNDGCQWRKYGQKIAKGNPCPRAYYRCTVSPSCPVRKQVQRCAQDMSILITTYEGTHNHPLPMSATAMASATSAAASMLTSGSMTSSMSNPNSGIGTTDLRGMSLYLTENPKLNPFYVPHTSLTTPSCPTITLDLTSNTISSSSSPFNRSSMPANLFPSTFSTTNLNFNSLESSALPISWSNGVLGYNNGAQAQVPYDHKNQIGFGTRQPQENIHQSYMQKSNMPMINSITPPIPQAIQPETIEAATKAITSDPNFQSALQVALTSIIARGSSGGGGGGGDKFGPSLRLPFLNSNGKSNSPETSQDHHVLR